MLVPYSNQHSFTSSPLGFMVAFTVADVGSIALAAPVLRIGAAAAGAASGPVAAPTVAHTAIATMSCEMCRCLITPILPDLGRPPARRACVSGMGQGNADG